MLGARRDDTGMYTLRVENEHGSDTADIDVVVMDVPTKPHGPLKISEVYGEGCTGTIAQSDTCFFIRISSSKQMINGDRSVILTKFLLARATHFKG